MSDRDGAAEVRLGVRPGPGDAGDASARARILPTAFRGLLPWAVTAALLTALLWWYREPLDRAHMALAYLLVVLGASARAGRAVALAIAVASFFAFNLFLLPPLYTLGVADPLDWGILLAFLTTAAVAGELLHRERRAVALAERRARDIERLGREAEQVHALREADRLKDAVLASVSHDLRTPLTTIRATAAELRRDGFEAAAIIEEEAERLSRFVTDLLDLSRIRAGSERGDPQLNAAEDLVGAALLRVQAVPGAPDVLVHLPVASEIPVGRFDFVQALSALGNLLENALRHAPEAPVELTVSIEGERLAFDVMDRGPGISNDDVRRIFEPFHRGADKGRRGGTGLGLAIARGAARAQGGDVEYRPRPGGGSVFRLVLPAARVPGLS